MSSLKAEIDELEATELLNCRLASVLIADDICRLTSASWERLVPCWGRRAPM